MFFLVNFYNFMEFLKIVELVGCAEVLKSFAGTCQISTVARSSFFWDFLRILYFLEKLLVNGIIVEIVLRATCSVNCFS